MGESSGNSIFYSMLGLLSFNILITIFSSSTMNYLFPLFNMIQIITLIPLLEINLPENFRSFIEEYLQFSNFKFDALYNPIENWGILDLSELNNNPLNENFKANNIHSRSLLVNYGGQLVIWTIIILLYIPVCVLAKWCKINKFKEIKGAYEYGVLLTSFSEAFIEFSLLAFLNLTEVTIYM